MPFDIQGARAAGYSDAEIADELAKDTKFDTAGARAAGYSDAEIISELQPATPSATAADRTQALASGLTSGFVSTAALPIDTGINALDVGKAALGAGYLGADYINRKFGGDGVEIPAFIRPTNRREVLGSSQNIKAGLNKIGVETEARRQDDAASRYLNIGGQLVSAVLSGGIYNKLGIPTGVPARPGAPPIGAAPPGTPPGGRPGAPPPPGFAPPGTPAGGAPPRQGLFGLGQSAPPAPAPGALGGPNLPAPLGLNSTEKATLAAGERLGLQVTPGVRVGSPQLRQIEAKLESFPSTSGPFESIKAANGKIIQQQLLRAIGEQGDEVSGEALARASERIGKVFDDAAANNKIAYDNDLQTSLADIGGRAVRELTDAELPQIQRQLNEIVNKAAQTGEIEGPAFQNIYSSLGRLTKNGTGGVKDAAGDIRDALHEALIRSAGPKAAEKLRTARDQYRVLITAEKSGAIDPGSGTVRAGQLAGAFSRNDKRGYLRGYNDSGLYDALRFANTRSFGPIVGNSGTATRLGGPLDLTQSVKALGGNLATRAYLNTPAPLLKAGVQTTNATNEVVRSMLGIPANQPVPIIIGLDAAEEDLRRGLFQ